MTKRGEWSKIHDQIKPISEEEVGRTGTEVKHRREKEALIEAGALYRSHTAHGEDFGFCSFFRKYAAISE